MRRKVFVALAGAALAAGLAWLLLSRAAERRTAPGTAPEASIGEPAAPPALSPAPAARALEPGEPLGERPAGDEATVAVAEAGHELEEATALDVAPNELPEIRTRVPHRVLAAWGWRKGEPGTGLVGGRLVVDPGLPTPELERLARDLRERFREEPAVHVEVFDSEEAASYDRHEDGGALAQRHLVAVVARNPAFGLDSIRIRGVEIPIEP